MTPIKLFVKEVYKGFNIVEIDHNTAVSYELAQLIQGAYRISQHYFSTIELAKKYIDELINSESSIHRYYNQSRIVCENCHKHLDINTETKLNKVERFQILQTSQSCPNCKTPFFKFNNILN